ncbi:hypothetical protein [Pelotomaculum sp. FP]|uniref:hypothetical protein n=1 Tax=Pelotomaculum sp. FP TaxID=261474 RepID=UPI0010662E20|nr:hypothetical protein [Pelotomaculum sp. FP]
MKVYVFHISFFRSFEASVEIIRPYTRDEVARCRVAPVKKGSTGVPVFTQQRTGQRRSWTGWWLLERLMTSLTKMQKDASKLVCGQGYSFAQARSDGCSRASAQVFVWRAEEKFSLSYESKQ